MLASTISSLFIVTYAIDLIFRPFCFLTDYRYSYVCPDLPKEFAKYDSQPDKWIRPHVVPKTAKYPEFSVDVGYERFLGPEIFFQPEVSVIFWNDFYSYQID